MKSIKKRLAKSLESCYCCVANHASDITMERAPAECVKAVNACSIKDKSLTTPVCASGQACARCVRILYVLLVCMCVCAVFKCGPMSMCTSVKQTYTCTGWSG